jgi:methylthioribose-1-phosphate isomerase
MPSSTIDWEIHDGVKDIPIEERDSDEVLMVIGKVGDNVVSARLAPDNASAANYAFDVTPARLVTGIITERGISKASEEGLRTLFPD